MQISETYSQVQSLIDGSQRILLATRKGPNLDGITSLLALSEFLKQKGKEVNSVAEDFNLKYYQYLPQAETIQGALPPQNLVVSIDLNSSPVEKINYETKGDKLELVITPQKGVIDPQKVHFTQTGLRADLLLAVDCQALESMGEIAQILKSSLQEIPIINLDNSNQNALFGKINWVDDKKISVTQMIFDFFKEVGLDITPSIALYLLSGLFFRTFGLQKNVDVQILRLVADLVEKGADYNLVTQNVSIKTSSVGSNFVLDNERAQQYIR